MPYASACFISVTLDHSTVSVLSFSYEAERNRIEGKSKQLRNETGTSNIKIRLNCALSRRVNSGKETKILSAVNDWSHVEADISLRQT